MTLALASALAACGGGAEDTSGAPAAAGVDKAALVAKLKETPEAKDVPDSTWDCMAAAMLKHGDQATLQGFVDGKVDVTNDFKAFGDKEAQIQREVSECE
ncbi:hypothetical protein [Nonomuraea cavernae]|uniref:hypothetical protein n=1 Tax=Nonomuraea cavernae TaxID=2045107 RepID=UPI001669EF2F|nr:hypothetical protein [Nonomuraea cavernae]MCA2186383.1 hypothetical protein [Nonomuraea cavernae]